ncbi:MAG: hypothetical protein ACFWTZ_04555 [Burkholderia sp.]|jgi:sulfide dehydrogenase cytochrome subunit
MRKLLAATVLLAALPFAAAPAAEPPAETLAHTCGACHGTNGSSVGETIVPIAGMKKNEFITSMKEFRDLKRPSSIMSHIAEGYSDRDIEVMAEYFAALPKPAVRSDAAPSTGCKDSKGANK